VAPLLRQPDALAPTSRSQCLAVPPIFICYAVRSDIHLDSQEHEQPWTMTDKSTVHEDSHSAEAHCVWTLADFGGQSKRGDLLPLNQRVQGSSPWGLTTLDLGVGEISDPTFCG
jgi:hypothetical protein